MFSIRKKHSAEAGGTGRARQLKLARRAKFFTHPICYKPFYMRRKEGAEAKAAKKGCSGTQLDEQALGCAFHSAPLSMYDSPLDKATLMRHVQQQSNHSHATYRNSAGALSAHGCTFSTTSASMSDTYIPMHAPP